MDQDDYARPMRDPAGTTCPYYRDGDEYIIVRHKM